MVASRFSEKCMFTTVFSMLSYHAFIMLLIYCLSILCLNAFYPKENAKYLCGGVWKWSVLEVGTDLRLLGGALDSR